jgi:hypothetical protein
MVSSFRNGRQQLRNVLHNLTRKRRTKRWRREATSRLLMVVCIASVCAEYI